MSVFFFFFFNDTPTTEIYTLSLHDALPICRCSALLDGRCVRPLRSEPGLTVLTSADGCNLSTRADQPFDRRAQCNLVRAIQATLLECSAKEKRIGTNRRRAVLRQPDSFRSATRTQHSSTCAVKGR